MITNLWHSRRKLPTEFTHAAILPGVTKLDFDITVYINEITDRSKAVQNLLNITCKLVAVIFSESIRHMSFSKCNKFFCHRFCTLYLSDRDNY